MAANTVNGSGTGARSGAQTLVLLATPLNTPILRALADGPTAQADLHRVTDSPPQTTLRAQLKRLTTIGAIEKQRRNTFPGTLEYGLTAAGHELLFVAAVLQRWLEQAPKGRLELNGGAARAAVKALAEGWSTTMLRALATGPLTLTQLNRLIGSLSYPSLERRLSALRLTGLANTCTGGSRGTPNAVTNWLRRGMGPMMAAARWERRHLSEVAPPVARLDIECMFLLTAPLLLLPTKFSGTCRMALEVATNEQLVGAMAQVEEGRIVSCEVDFNGKGDAWALGTASAWLNALVADDATNIEIGGDSALMRELLLSLHEVLVQPNTGVALDVERSIRDDRTN